MIFKVFRLICQVFTVRNEVAKVMFLHMSVSHSVHRVVLSQHALHMVSQHALQQGGVLSQHALQMISQHALQQGGSAPRERVPALGCLLQGGAWSQGGVETTPKADGYCCGFLSVPFQSIQSLQMIGLQTLCTFPDMKPTKRDFEYILYFSCTFNKFTKVHNFSGTGSHSFIFPDAVGTLQF